MSNETLDPSAIPIETLCAILTRVGSMQVTPKDIQSLIAKGLPNNPDGTIDLVVYTAWLTKIHLSE